MQGSIAANLTWGDCFFRERSMSGHYVCTRWSRNVRCPTWESPSCDHHRPIQTLNFNKQKCKNPYQGLDLFAVVRNPYDRALSEYFYANVCENCRDPNHMNNELKKRLGRHVSQPALSKSFLGHCNHDFPQYDYVYDTSLAGRSNQTQPKRLVRHVLKFENLATDFQKLMHRYGLNVSLPEKKGNPSNRSLGVEDLSEEVVEIINKIYAQDFEAFGYEMISQNRTRW